MNNRISFILGIIFMVSGFLNAGGLSTQGSRLILEGTIFKSGALTVSVYDNNDIIVFNKTIVNTSKGQKINLEKLTPGSYTIRISDEYKVLSQKVDVKKGQVELMDAEAFSYKPIIKEYNSKVFINYLNQGKPVIIRITDKSGNVFYIEKVDNSQKVEKSFNLSKLATGSYYVTVSTDDEIFEKSINI